MNVVLCPDKKRRDPKVQLFTHQGPVQEAAEPRWQLLQVLTSCPAFITEGARRATQLTLRLQRPPKSPTDCGPGTLPGLLGHRNQDGGEVHHCLEAWATDGGWPWWGFWSPVRHSPKPVLWAPSSPTGPRLGELEGLREKVGLCLLPHSPPHDHHSTVVWIPSLTVIS